jgi:hypothetical protein
MDHTIIVYGEEDFVQEWGRGWADRIRYEQKPWILKEADDNHVLEILKCKKDPSGKVVSYYLDWHSHMPSWCPAQGMENCQHLLSITTFSDHGTANEDGDSIHIGRTCLRQSPMTSRDEDVQILDARFQVGDCLLYAAVKMIEDIRGLELIPDEINGLRCGLGDLTRKDSKPGTFARLMRLVSPFGLRLNRLSSMARNLKFFHTAPSAHYMIRSRPKNNTMNHAIGVLPDMSIVDIQPAFTCIQECTDKILDVWVINTK